MLPARAEAHPPWMGDAEAPRGLKPTLLGWTEPAAIAISRWHAPLRLPELLVRLFPEPSIDDPVGDAIVIELDQAHVQLMLQVESRGSAKP